jgi:hypothetical protein
MKRFSRLMNCTDQKRAAWGVVVIAVGTVVAAVLGMPSSLFAVVVTDDFSDLNDTANPTWTHLNNEVGSTDQVWDASTGRYRLYAPSNGTVPGVEGYGFVGSYTGPSFTDVRVTADIVEFPNVGPTGSFFAITARLNGDNSLPSPGVGLPLRGYSYQYEAGAAGGLGEMVLNLVYGDGLKDLRPQKGQAPTGIEPLLDNTKDYRFMFEVIGNVLHGQVIELDAGGSEVGIVAEQWRNVDLSVEPVGNIDHDGDNSTAQIPFDPSTIASGFSGAYAVGYILATDGDVTIDNFKTETAVAGDYNRNGVTDGGDYVLWRKTLGNAGPTANPPTSFSDMRANGDVTAGEFSQIIDQADYDFWRSKFGSSASGSGLGGGGGVPEPASRLLVILGLATVSLRGKGGKRCQEPFPRRKRFLTPSERR